MSKQSRKTARRKVRQEQALEAAKAAGFRVEYFGAPVTIKVGMLSEQTKQRIVERYGAKR